MYNIVELFSGIGSQVKAMENIDIKIGDAYTCEWDIHALTAYDAIHNSPNFPFDFLKLSKNDLLVQLAQYTLSNNGKSSMGFDILKTYSISTLRRIYASIKRCNNFVDVSKLKGETIPDNIDILTYSFPCQDLSNVGAFHGYNKGIDKDSKSRSSLLWQVGRILEEMKASEKRLPKFLLMENVPALLSSRHKNNFMTWIFNLRELGYLSKYYQLNASDFGLPQNRPRLLMISVFVGDDKNFARIVSEFFAQKSEKEVITDYRESPYFNQFSIKDLLRVDYSNKQLFDEACECTPNETVSRKKIWDENPQLVLDGNQINAAFNVVRTITTKQDRNPNSGNLYFDSKIARRSHFRYLTPRECFLFMGFTDDDFDNVTKYKLEIRKGTKLFSRDKLIRMAGNSIPVKLLEGIIYQIKLFDELIRNNRIGG